MINDLGFKEIAEDLLFPSPGTVPILNSRQNREVTIGFTGLQSTARNPTSGGIAEPSLIHGTKQYARVFVKLTLLAKSQAGSAGFEEPFSNLSGDFATRREFAQKIDPANEIENVSFLAYVHEFAYVESFLDWLKAHFDHENCPHLTWDVAMSAWKTMYLQKLGRYVTVVIIGNSRKSISDALHRRLGIGKAADVLMRRFDRNPEYIKSVLKSTLCPRNFKDPYRVIPVHFEQLVDLSPAIFHILQYRDSLVQAKGLKLSKYLVAEMIVSFAFINNRYRFHLFCKQFLTKWKRTGVLPLCRDATFVGNFLCWLYKTYGCWSGSKMKNGQSEGAVCLQTTKTHPILSLSINKTLGSFSHSIDGMETKEANLSNFRKTVQLLNESIEGSGNLLNQKSIGIVTGCGRASNTNWLKHCIPGSAHHSARLKQSSFFFTSSDQVMQLARYLTSLGDQNGPMNGPKVDEVICKTLKGPASEAMFHDIVIAG
jgi:hypothetical protein